MLQGSRMLMKSTHVKWRSSPKKCPVWTTLQPGNCIGVARIVSLFDSRVVVFHFASNSIATGEIPCSSGQKSGPLAGTWSAIERKTVSSAEWLLHCQIFFTTWIKTSLNIATCTQKLIGNNFWNLAQPNSTSGPRCSSSFILLSPAIKLLTVLIRVADVIKDRNAIKMQKAISLIYRWRLSGVPKYPHLGLSEIMSTCQPCPFLVKPCQTCPYRSPWSLQNGKKTSGWDWDGPQLDVDSDPSHPNVTQR